MINHLVMFTSSYPFGNSENFIELELLYLSKQYNSITIYPFHYKNGSTLKRKVPDNVYVVKPVIPKHWFQRIIKFLFGLFSIPPLRIFLKEFYNYKVFSSKRRIYTWTLSLIDFVIMFRSTQYKELLNISGTSFYFYWGMYWALGLPHLKNKSLNKNNKYFIRLHGGDVFLERSNNYLPMRHILYSNADVILSISSKVKHYLIDLYAIADRKIIINRLGIVLPIKKNPNPTNYSLIRLVSVSNLISLKRVNLIVSALSQLSNKKIEWHHFGTGPLLDNLINSTKNLNPNIKVKFWGHVDNEKIHAFYSMKPIDAFINVSEYEGIPYSIIEAMSYGIPCIATDAGATSELVNNLNGFIIPINFNTSFLTDLIINVKEINWFNKREKARDYIFLNYNSDNTYKALIDQLQKLTD